MGSLTSEATSPIVGEEIEEPDLFACSIIGYSMRVAQSVDLHASTCLILDMDGQPHIALAHPKDLPPGVEWFEVDSTWYIEPPSGSGLDVRGARGTNSA